MRPRAWRAAWMLGLCVLATQAFGSSRQFDHDSTGYPLVGMHRDAECATCHVDSLFKGTPRDCFSCHSPGSRVGGTTKPARHIVSGPDCSSCHTPFSWIPVAKFNHLNVIGTCSSCHNNVQSQGKSPSHLATAAECNTCHSVSQPWTQALAIPANHIPFAPSVPCTSCHRSSDYAVLPSLADIHANAPSTSVNCAQCHGPGTAPGFAIPAANFSIVTTPPSHLPTDAPCESCHVGPGSSIAATPVGNGARFAGSAVNHAGLTYCSGCHGQGVAPASFYGIARIVVMPASAPPGVAAHIPTAAACDACHVAPAGLVPATATAMVPGTAFQRPVPTTAQIHHGVSGGCSGCHEGGNVWLGASLYPIAPAALTGVASTQYTGFQTRPGTAAGTFQIADPAHPASGDCGACHTRTDYFEGVLKPANHIPTASGAACSNCHRSTDFSVLPSVTDIHANAPSTSADCAQCHDPTVAPGFAIPAANFAIVTTPANHLPSGAACETCHVGAGSSIAATPVLNGAKFAGSAMSHSGVTTCVACHGPAVGATSFAGISRIVVMPATTPAGPAAHVPSGTACEGCHAGSVPAGLVPANATATPPGTGFAAPAPTTAMIHAGVTSGCNACHEGGDAWLDMAQYPIAPAALTGQASTQYTGFQTRPGKTASSFQLADAAHPTSGDCSACHTRTDYFEGVLKPANHIPTATGAACSACHTSTDFAALPTLTNIHANAPSTSANCAQCHGPTVAPGFAIPAANFAIVTTPSNHLPTSASCEACHVGAGSSIAATPVVDGARFANSLMSHAGATTCAPCHGPAVTGSSFVGVSALVTLPPTSPAGPNAHIPAGVACEGCHVAPAGLVAASSSKLPPGTAFQAPAPSTAQIHAGITAGCSACHEGGNVWLDASLYPIAPPALTGLATTQYTGFQTRPGKSGSTYQLVDAVHPASGDCSQCHSNTNYFEAVPKPANHIPTASGAACQNCHTSSDFSVLPTLTNIHANAPSTSANCAQCHGPAVAPGFAIPAANFQIVTMPSGHVPTSAACESCHVGTGSSIAATPVTDGAKFAGSAMNHAGLTTCVGCHGPGVASGTFYGITRLIVMPATSPAGAAAHIPSATSCESCHVAPAGLVAGNATAAVPGSAFQQPAPTTAQIHAGVSSGCSACHEGGNVWLDMGQYPIAPAALTGLTTTQYTGFQTRPGKVAGTFQLADAAHPTSGDCSQCHANTNYFEPLPKPANHIPTASGASCSACHTSTDFSVLPTLTNIHANAPSTSANCAQCHGPTTAPGFAIPAANFTIVTTPSNHLPTSAACESCHVGAGSSVPATPVVDGEKFAGSAMNHAGLTTCAGCHGPAVAAGAFAGITALVGLPPTSPMGPAAHIPSATTCESCHAAPSGLLPANSTKVPPGTGFQSPAPSTGQIHAGVTSGCSNCHEGGNVWLDMGQYPIAPAALTGLTTTQYTGFQTRPGKTAGTFQIADAVHPASGDCSQCHGNTNYFEPLPKPANHIPTASGAACQNCHTSTDFSVLPTLTNIHANAPSTSANCAQCHGPTVAPGFAIPAANFAIVTTPSNHLPTSAPCESCHVGAGSSVTATPVMDGAKFSGSAMNHAGISTCVACHGPAVTGSSFAGVLSIVVMPATSPVGAGAHIPSGTACEGCHQGAMPVGLVPANATRAAPGTLFQAPAPTTAMIHAGVTSGCASCHEGGNVWLDMGQYPIAPTALGGASSTPFTGFQTRPGKTAGTYVVADPAHPATGDCSSCHTRTDYFEGQLKPANHIPTASGATCQNCHTSSDFSVLPTLTAIHAYAPSTSANCAQCHGPTVAPGFAIPAANFTIVTTPANHVPTSAACESCHVGAGSSVAATPVVNGAKFSGSAMNHAGITSCAACHGPTVTGATFVGITTLIAMPPTSPAGPAAHVPSSIACESCHQASMPVGLIPANATRTVPGSLFAAPAPTTTMIHAGVTSGCAACHEGGNVWLGVALYPIAPTALTGLATTQYTGFQTRPGKAAGTYTLLDGAHPATGDCGACHARTDYFEGVLKPANHIPTATGANCGSCHTTTDFSVLPTLTNIHANAPSTSANCAQCHGPSVAPSFAIPAANFAIVTTPSNHLPTSAPCESCHVGAGSSVAATPVVNGAKFSGSTMNHAGLTTCVACHGPTVTGSSFAGITRIVAMPATSPAGAGAHVPSGTACEGCHLGSMPAGSVAANATKSPPGTGFATPVPTTAMIHAGVSSGCAACHEGGNVWLDMGQYPIAPTALTGVATTQYTGFQTRPGKAAGTFSLLDGAHPTTGDCSACHSRTDYFEGLLKPANHIPTATGANCGSCHTSTDFSVLPTLTAIHANAPSTSVNCAQCHGPTVAPGFAIPAANFTIVTTPANHVPTSAPCESCHVGAGSSIAATPVINGAKFSGSAMSHAGLTTCVACHGPTVTGTSFAGITRIIAMPATSPAGAASHIPSSTACEGCHLGSMPSGFVPANAVKTVPGSGFQAPVPTTAMIHAGVTSGCASCHEGGNVWLDVAQYPIAPTALTGVATTQYTGFQTRPGKAAGTFMLLDGAHPTTGDCSACHSRTDYFEGVLKPANHIPTATGANCGSCHTTTDFSVLPTLTAIHANAPSTTANCAQCHGPTVAPGFAIPAANFTIVTTPANHLPTSAPCESCHVGAGSSIAATPVVNGAKFSGSAMSHAGLTTCVACHGPTVTGSSFAGITRIIAMPPTSPAGAASHIPSTTACEGCHLGSTPSAFVPANAVKTVPGSGFEAPVPTTAMIHAGVTSGCTSCHEGGNVWLDMGQYPIAPTALTGVATTQYTGFQTRPGKVAGAFMLLDGAHPTSGDCASCHTRTDYFEGLLKPANHIPTAATAACTSCHTGTDFSVLPTLTAIHANAPSTTANCAQCHGPAVAPGFAIPAANFSIVTTPSNHVPTSAPCESCHVGAGSSIAATPVVNGAKFSGSAMSHAGLTTCVSCHGPAVPPAGFFGIAKVIVMPPTSPMGAASHIPSATACEGCHGAPAGLVPASATKAVPGSGFQTPVPTTAQIHAGITSGCSSCHEGGYQWLDAVTNYPLSPATLSLAGTQYTGFQTRPGKTATATNLADAAHPTSGDCSGCHTRTDYFEGQLKPANHIPTAATATCTNCHTSTDFSVLPTLANIHLYAPSTSTNCSQCHGATVAAGFAIPAANFSIVTLPANHVPTSASCETCHVGTGSSIAATPVPNGAKFSGSAMSHAGLTTCVGCHGPTVAQGTFYGVTKLIVMPPTSPMGSTSHIPSATACESCHGAPAGLVPGSSAKSVPGSGFLSPLPTTAQIHGGISGGCAACHEGGNTWLDMGQYPIVPAALSSVATTQYTGFQTRPGAVAGPFVIADRAHPTSGDCSACHARTDYFEGQLKPANHIPTAASAACNNCHTSTDFSQLPTLANIHLYAPSTSANCSQCHGASVAAGFAIPAANFSIVTLPANHVPTSASCEQCHVGTGSSIAATPVPNGAKFSGSAMSHAGITTCVGCHGPTVTPASFAGITVIVTMPPTSPVGAAAHIPSGTACEGCHLGAAPSALVPANAAHLAPGTAFATPVPTTAMIHAGLTSGCAACHEAGSVWMDVAKYPIAPTAVTGLSTTQYTGFQTRPVAAAGTYNVADAAHPTSGDCSQCHTGTSYFTAQAEPPNHIPTLPGAACATCHTTAGNFAVYTTNLTTLHTAVVSTCSSCHADGKGPFAAATGFTIVQMSTRGVHIPITNVGAPVECNGCHKSVTAFSGTLMSHSAIGDTALAATGNACDACHEYGFRSKFYGVTINWTRDSSTHHICGAPGTPTAPNVTLCTGGGSDCLTGCHEHDNQIPSTYKWRPPRKPAATATPAAPATAPARPGTGPDRRPARHELAQGLLAPADAHAGASPASCATCHDGVHASGLPPTHARVTRACGDCHTTLAWRPVARLDHSDVLARCATCHGPGGSARGKPAGHIASGDDCDSCHTTSAWRPAAFDHRAVIAGSCSTCHNGVAASGKSARHVVTSAACDSCHYTVGWRPVKPATIPPAKRPAVPRGRTPLPLSAALPGAAGPG
ncbi:MAG: hypothetical protein JSR73_09950 [Proteobacteria bacterium]|nr:hypothetical protein [Pseudomonadota bacterium]